MTEASAESIITFRGSGRGPIRSVGQLLGDVGLDEELFQEIAERVTVRSSVFQITSIGITNRGVRQRIVAVLDRGQRPPSIIYWYQGN